MMVKFVLLAAFVSFFELITNPQTSVMAQPIDSTIRHSYERNLDLTLQQDGSVMAFWTVDMKRKEFEMAIVAPTTGWLGIGLSAQGSMKGADMWILERENNGDYTLGDYFATDFERPKLDPDYLQNVVLKGVDTNATHTAFRFIRTLETCDDKTDIAVTATPQYLIFAYGDSPTLEYHESSNRGQRYTSLILDEFAPPEPEVPDERVYRINQTSPPLRDILVDDAVGVIHALEFSLEEFNYTIPSEDIITSTCFTFDFKEQLKGMTLFFTGSTAINAVNIDHHAVVAAIPESLFAAQLVGTPIQENCYSPSLNSRGVLGWTKGNSVQMLPDDVYGYLGDDPNGSIPIPNPNIDPNECDDDAINCRYHITVAAQFQNPDLDLVDTSTKLGFRLYFRTTPLKHEFGMFRVSSNSGDINIPAHKDVTVTARCPSTCLDQLIDDKGISIMAITNYAPRATNIETRIIRDGKELEPLSLTPFYDRNRQTKQLPRRKLLRGDQLVTKFEYTGSEKPVYGGFTFDDELAFATVFYYPVIQDNADRILSCGSTKTEPSKVYCGGSLEVLFGAEASNWPTADVMSVPENELPTAEYVALTNEDEVCNVIFNSKAADPLSAITPITFMLLFCIALFLHLITSKLLHAKSATFQAMPLKNQLNVVVYIVSTIYCTVALLMTISVAYEYVAAPDSSPMQAGNENGQLELATSADYGFTVVSIVAILMLYELCAKPAPDTFLIVHHVMTMGVIALFVVGTHRTGQTIFASCGLTMTLQLTTEQPTYIAMLLKRFKAPPAVVGKAFKLGAVVAVILKPTIFALVMWMASTADVWSGIQGREFSTFVHNDSARIFDVFWIVLTVAISCLQAVQWIQVKQLWAIGKAAERKLVRLHSEEESNSGVGAQLADNYNDVIKEEVKLQTVDLSELRRSHGSLQEPLSSSDEDTFADTEKNPENRITGVSIV